MHKIVVLSLSLLAACTALATPPMLTPNLYTCKGDGVSVVYTTTGIDGRSSLTFTFGEGDTRTNASGYAEEITKSNTLLGQLVSVYVGAIPDAQTTYASVIIPRINLRGMSSEDAVPFNSLLISTTKKTSFGGPNFVNGVLDESETLPLSCTAQFVHF